MTNHPWPMDKDLHDFHVVHEYPPTEELVRYLLDRLKIAEAERDRLREWTAPFKKGWE